MMRKYWLIGFIWLCVGFAAAAEGYTFQTTFFVLFGIIPAALIVGIPWVRREKTQGHNREGSDG